MGARPIPRKLLIHTAKHNYGTITVDDWGTRTYTSTRDLKRVRFEPVKSLNRTFDNRGKAVRALLFYDCTNSDPVGLDFVAGDEIVFESQPYEILEVAKFADNARWHHFELRLG